jgi:hypothetical protein
MINNLSNRSFAWLAGTLILSIVVIAMVMQHMKEINNALGYAQWGFYALVILSALYGIYRLWHAEHLRAMDRKERQYSLAQQKHQALMLEEEAATRKTSRDLMQEAILLMRDARALGHSVNLEYAQDGTIKRVQTIAAQRQAKSTAVQEIDTPEAAPQLEAPLPTNVLYEDVRNQVPRGHVLVGVGRTGIETKDQAVGACVWIVGLSGTGKTSTTVLRVEERAAAGHKFLGADPHYFKPDSLTNAVKAYEHDFMMPMARDIEGIKAVLATFLNEFNARKAGRVPQPWQPITLLVDEVGSLMDPTSADKEERAAEEEIKKMLPSIARICGQEARNFNMGGIFISQQATGLAWLRKVALMVIVHQLLMENEKKLALNGDTEAMESMKTWPRGRTYVYGVGFEEGPRTVQQPFFKGRVIDSTIEPARPQYDASSYNATTRKSEPLNVSRIQDTDPTVNGLKTASQRRMETASQAGFDDVEELPITEDFLVDEASSKNIVAGVSAEKLETIARMKKSGYPDREIAKLVGLSGRKYALYQGAVQLLEMKEGK